MEKVLILKDVFSSDIEAALIVIQAIFDNEEGLDKRNVDYLMGVKTRLEESLKTSKTILYVEK